MNRHLTYFGRGLVNVFGFSVFMLGILLGIVGVGLLVESYPYVAIGLGVVALVGVIYVAGRNDW